MGNKSLGPTFLITVEILTVERPGLVLFLSTSMDISGISLKYLWDLFASCKLARDRKTLTREIMLSMVSVACNSL